MALRSIVQAMSMLGDEPLARGEDAEPPAEEVVGAWRMDSKTSAQQLRDVIDGLSPAETRTKDVPVRAAPGDIPLSSQVAHDGCLYLGG